MFYFAVRAESSCFSSKQQSFGIVLFHLLNNMNFHPRYRYYLMYLHIIKTHDGVVGVAPQACSTAPPQRREQAAGPAPHQRHDVQY